MNDLKLHTFVQYFPDFNKSRNQGMTVLTHRFTGFWGCPSNTGVCIPYSLLSFLNLFLEYVALVGHKISKNKYKLLNPQLSFILPCIQYQKWLNLVYHIEKRSLNSYINIALVHYYYH